MESMRKDLEKCLSGYKAEDFREDDGLRLGTRDAVNEMLKKFSI